MKASCLIAPGHYETIDVTKPEPQNGQVLVRMQLAALCGSDLHIFHGRPRLEQYPSIPGFSGHEAVGIVERSTEGNWRPGDPVLVIPPQINAFAEYTVVPASQLIPLPDDATMDQWVLAQQLGTVLFSCRQIGNLVDKVVAVLGQGPAGLMFTALARRMGARFIIGIDIVPHRLKVAQLMGANAIVNAEKVDPGTAVAELTGGKLADVAIEAIGDPKTINGLSKLIHVGGRMVFYGIPPSGPIDIDFERFFRCYAHTITTAGAPDEPGFHSFRLAVDMIERGTINIKPLISHILPLDDIQKAFTLADSKDDGAVKVLLDLTT